MELTTALVIVTATVCALLAVRLHLRWRVRHEQSQRRYLTQVAEVATAGCHFELDDQRGHGQRLRVSVTRMPVAKENRAA